MTESEDWAARYERERKEQEQRVREKKFFLMNTLRDKGIRILTISYDGSGDDGSINDIVGTDRAGVEVHLDPPLREEFNHFGYDLLESNFPGWENNEGAFGEIVFEVLDNKVRFTHNARIEEVETSEEEF